MRHIRERGFDHIDVIANKMACEDRFRVRRLLYRNNNTVQVGADAEKRKEQAQKAYAIRGSVDTDANYLLLDDVWTTGSSMLAACNLLRACGCQKINIAVIAKSG